MALMKSVRLYKAGDLRVERVERPGAPRPGWVRLAVNAAGICGSDLHNFRTGQWISRSPSVAGHEFAGEVLAIGEGVKTVGVGDKVVADSRFWCGECDACRAGLRQVCERLGFVGEVCDGGFAEETELPERLLIRHDAGLDPAIAAFSEPLAVALHAVRRLAAPEGEPVLVVGCGPIGGLAALLLSRLHKGPILVADRNEARAMLVGNVAGGRPVALDRQALHSAAGGEPVRFAIDATGNVKVLEQLVDILSPAGAVALVGISHGKIALDPNRLVEREMALIGCHAFAGELGEAVAMLADLAPALTRLIDAEISLDDVPAAYDRLLAGQAAGLKTIIRMDKTVPGRA